jgi:hypothetical protein
MTAPKKDLVSTVIDLVDVVVEIYLSSIIKPFLKIHERFYASLNSVLRGLLDDHKKSIPVWFTANFITYARTVLVFPTIVLLAWGHTVLPAIVVVLVDFGDFLDGVVARYWVDVRKEDAAAAESKDKSRSASPTNSDNDSFGKSKLMMNACIVEWEQCYSPAVLYLAAVYCNMFVWEQYTLSFASPVISFTMDLMTHGCSHCISRFILFL